MAALHSPHTKKLYSLEATEIPRKLIKEYGSYGIISLKVETPSRVQKLIGLLLNRDKSFMHGQK